MSAKTLELLDKINRIAGNGNLDTLSKLEYDLLLQYLRDFYEVISDYKIKPAIKGSDSVIQHSFKEVTQAASIIKGTAKTDEEETYSISTTELQVKEDSQSDQIRKVSSISDNESQGDSLNDKLKSTSSNEIHKKLSSKPLKELIDLNKRFVILNELFSGDSDAYSKTIKEIDSYTDFDSAQSFVQSSVAEKYGWDETAQSVRMFNKLIRQKFGFD